MDDDDDDDNTMQKDVYAMTFNND